MIQVRLIEVIKVCIYTWLNLNLKPVFFLIESLIAENMAAYILYNNVKIRQKIPF